MIQPEHLATLFLVLCIGLAGLRLKVLENRKSVKNESFNGDFMSSQKDTVLIRDTTHRVDPNNGIFF